MNFQLPAGVSALDLHRSVATEAQLLSHVCKILSVMTCSILMASFLPQKKYEWNLCTRKSADGIHSQQDATFSGNAFACVFFFLHHITMHNEIKPGIFWVVCLSGVGVEGRDPGCWGLWHGDTFECGRYDGARMGVRVDTRQILSCFIPRDPFETSLQARSKTFVLCKQVALCGPFLFFFLSPFTLVTFSLPSLTLSLCPSLVGTHSYFLLSVV